MMKGNLSDEGACNDEWNVGAGKSLMRKGGSMFKRSWRVKGSWVSEGSLMAEGNRVLEGPLMVKVSWVLKVLNG